MKIKRLYKLLAKYDRKVFGNQILNSGIILDIYSFNSKKYMGYFSGVNSPEGFIGEIYLSRKYLKDIKSTLIHEMVHCIQFIRGKKVNHGKYFKRECRRIKKEFNINIK